jgi:hypothetical protein
LEKERDETTAALCAPAIMSDTEIYPQTLKRHRDLEARLHHAYEEWAVIAQKIERVQSAFSDLE